MSIDPRWAVIVADGDSDAAALERALAGARGGSASSGAAAEWPAGARGGSASSGAAADSTDAVRLSTGAAAGSPAEDSPGRPLLIGADHGALRAEALGLLPDLMVGDADSLSSTELERLRVAGVRIQLAASAKDESDTELCLHTAIGEGAVHIRLIGALGGPRPEHSVANLLLLGLPALDGLDVAIVTATSTIRRIGTAEGPGTLDLEGGPADHVSLFAIDSVVEGVHTDGLRFPLHHEPLKPGPARGLSNELIGESASVSCARGRLLVIHTQRQPEMPA